MDYSVEQEFKKVYKQLKCKANCNSVDSYIVLTLSSLQNLVSTETLKTNAVYFVSDVYEGLVIRAVDSSTLDTVGELLLFTPDYTLHNQYHSTDGAIADNAIVTWGGFYWQNTSGGAVTPDLPDEVEIDSNPALFTRISKSGDNGYTLISLEVFYDAVTNSIYKATDKKNNSIEFKTNSFTYGSVNLETYQWNLPITNFANNMMFICNNVVEEGGLLSNNDNVAGMFIKRCKIDATSGIFNNTGLGNDYQVGEINNCIVSNSGFITGNELHLSYIRNTNVNGLNNGASIDECHLTNESFMLDCSITGGDCYFASCWFDRESGFEDVNITGTFTALNCVELYDNAVISNYSIVNNGQTTSVTSNKSLDLTGFTSEFHENIENGKGWFTVTHDFATSPLVSGSSLLFNLLPDESRVTSIKTFGTTSGGAGAELAFGIETDAPNLLASAVLATVNAGQTYDLVSTPATANRSLAITASVANITGGSLTVLIEFIS